MYGIQKPCNRYIKTLQMKAFEGSVIHDVCNLVTIFYLSCLLNNVEEMPVHNAGNVQFSVPCASVTVLGLGFPVY